MRTDKSTTGNSGLAKVAVQCSADTFVVNQSYVLRINICGVNRHLRKAANRYATFMRSFVLIFMLLGYYSNSHCQIIGRTLLYDEGAWSMISVNGELPYKTTDGEGNFQLELPKKVNSIFVLTSWISIEIRNIPNFNKINIGEIGLPMRKSISVKEYEDLSGREKELCIPVNCWNQLLGYEFKNQLAERCLILKCGQVKYEICEFEFDIENQKVVIEWEKVKVCGK